MRCRLCDSDALEIHFDFGPQPIAHHLTDGPFMGERYPFRVAFCEACGFEQLVDHIAPEVLYRDYFTLSSWKPQPHATRVIEVAEKLFGIAWTDPVFEIGCNDGSFLQLLKDRGYTNLAGIEPAADAHRSAVAKGFAVDHAFFAKPLLEKPRLIITRQVLEHVPDFMAFLAAARDSLQPNGGLVIEVPDHAMNYEALDYTFWEEHVNYFTINTLRLALERSGFEVIHHETTLFTGRALIVYATPAPPAPTGVFARPPLVHPPINRDRDAAINYRDIYPRFREAAYRHVIDGPVTPSGDVVLYGAGCRSTNFFNLLGLSQWITGVYDDRVEKWGKYLPGFGVPITAGHRVPEDAHVLLGVNAECEWTVARSRGLKYGESILPPSRRLPRFWKEMALSAGRGRIFGSAA